jgi:outer membrane protein
MKNQPKSIFCCGVVVIASAGVALAQMSSTRRSLPDAPSSNFIVLSSTQQIPDATPVIPSQSAATPTGGGTQPKLTRSQAEQMAIKNNPRISVAHLLALAQHQTVRETRAGELPTSTISVTAVEAENASRISAGFLNSPSVFEHAGAGASFSQLITDFGRTSNLVTSSKLQEKAQNSSAQATLDDIVIATDQAFYNALQSQALYRVAVQNVTTRQTTESQVSELTRNNLKSTLDLSFADVNLSQAKLLLLDAQNNVQASMATLDAVLGLDHEVTYDLVDDAPNAQAPPGDVDQLVQLGLKQRPDLQALDLEQQAAVKYSHAQRDQMLPSIAAAGTVGGVPIRPPQYYVTNWWGAIGVNMNIPVFNGFLYSAEAKEATIRARAAAERSRDLRDQIVRDIRTSWLAANTAYQRTSVAQQLLQQANLSLQLAQTRYQIGLSSIVELSQAQYQQTDAAIGNTNAEYQYRLALATLNYQVGATP